MENSDKILELFSRGKKLAKEKMYDEAIANFLDAAELTVQYAKISTEEDKHRYERIANMIIEEIKETKAIKHLTTTKSVESHEIGNDLKPEDIQMKDEPVVSDSSALERETSKEKVLIPDVFENYVLAPKQDIDIPLGETKEGIYHWKPSELMNGIVMITGGSGSGKSDTLKSFAKELTERGYPALVIDLHGDLTLEIPKIDINFTSKFGINPLELFSVSSLDGGPEPQINRLVQLFDDAVEDGFSSTQLAFIRNLLGYAYQQAHIIQGNPETWKNSPPTFKDVKNIVSTYQTLIEIDPENSYLVSLNTATNATLNAVINRLSPILNHPAFVTNEMIPIGKLTEFPLRINLKSIHTVDMQYIVVDSILHQLFSRLRSKGHVEGSSDEERFRMFVLIDEVKILSGNRGDINDSFNILNRLASESRKFGIGMIVASQVIRHFGRDIRSNSATKIVLRAMDNEEARVNAKEIEIDNKLLKALRKPGLGYIRTTNDIVAKKIQIFPFVDRPIHIEVLEEE